jgi:hypothetical protein
LPQPNSAVRSVDGLELTAILENDPQVLIDTALGRFGGGQSAAALALPKESGSEPVT